MIIALAEWHNEYDENQKAMKRENLGKKNIY